MIAGFSIVIAGASRLGGDAGNPNGDPDFLKQQNAELQHQLREAIAQLDDFKSRPPLHRSTVLSGPLADTPLLSGSQEATGTLFVFYAFVQSFAKCLTLLYFPTRLSHWLIIILLDELSLN